MSCPLLRKGHVPRCGAVSGVAVPPRLVLSTLCRGDHESCPAFRYTRAAGKLLHPSDFVAWVVRGITPGCEEATPHPG